MAIKSPKKRVDALIDALSIKQFEMLVGVAKGFIWQSIHDLRCDIDSENLSRMKGPGALSDDELLGLMKRKTDLTRLVCDDD